MCCLNYKGKAVEGRELSVAQINCRQETAGILVVAAETGLKSDGMFAIVIRTALFITILFT